MKVSTQFIVVAVCSIFLIIIVQCHSHPSTVTLATTSVDNFAYLFWRALDTFGWVKSLTHIIRFTLPYLSIQQWNAPKNFIKMKSDLLCADYSYYMINKFIEKFWLLHMDMTRSCSLPDNLWLSFLKKKNWSITKLSNSHIKSILNSYWIFNALRSVNCLTLEQKVDIELALNVHVLISEIYFSVSTRKWLVHTYVLSGLAKRNAK